MRLFTSTTFWVLTIIMSILYIKMPDNPSWDMIKDWGEMALNGFYGYVIKEVGQKASNAYKERKDVG